MTLQTTMPACSSSPIPAVAHRVAAPAALAPDQYRSLLDDLAHIADIRHRRGRRHTLGTVLAALGARRDALRRVYRPPAGATVRRMLARVDPDALYQVIGRCLTDQQPPPATRVPWRQAVAVDGKTLRGSGHHGNPQVHLLAVMDHTSRAVLGQIDVDHTSNEIARFPAPARRAGPCRVGHYRRRAAHPA
jgi:hypothetical protein